MGLHYWLDGCQIITYLFMNFHFSFFPFFEKKETCDVIVYNFISDWVLTAKLGKPFHFVMYGWIFGILQISTFYCKTKSTPTFCFYDGATFRLLNWPFQGKRSRNFIDQSILNCGLSLYKIHNEIHARNFFSWTVSFSAAHGPWKCDTSDPHCHRTPGHPKIRTGHSKFFWKIILLRVTRVSRGT